MRLSKIPPTKPKNQDGKFFVLDIETNKLEASKEAFVFGCIYGVGLRVVFRSIAELEKELQKAKYRSKYIFAHNSEFDFTALFGNIIELDNKAIFSGSRFIACKYGKVRLANSLNILPTSVKKVGEQLGLEKMENEAIFKELEQGIISEQAIEYCFRDCEIIFIALSKIFNALGSVKCTIGGICLYTFRKNFLKKDIHFNAHAYHFFESYYGGRVEAFKIGKTYAYKYDVNSMYPYSMRETKFPDPNSLREFPVSKWDYFYKHYLMKKPYIYEGLIYCKVSHKQTVIGFLPKRVNGKLLFPFGVFSGCWNFNELRYAIEKGIVEILEVERIVFSLAVESPFIDFINTNYQARINSTGFMQFFYKLLLNNLYGKFAQRLEWDSEYYSELPIERIIELNQKGKKYKLMPFSVERNDGFILIKRKSKYFDWTIPIYSSYITSHSRLILLEYLLNSEGLVYCDTDSICLEKELPTEMLSNELGGLKKELEVITEIRGPKNYTEIKPNGDELIKIKGIPKNALQIGKNRFKFTKMVKSKEGLRRNIDSGLFIEVVKQMSGKYDKRKLNADGSTEILEINE